MKAILAKGLLVFFCTIAYSWAETPEISRGNSIFYLAMINRPFQSAYNDRNGPAYKLLTHDIKYSVETLYYGLKGNYTVSRVGRARSTNYCFNVTNEFGNETSLNCTPITRVGSILSFSAYKEGFNRNEISTFWNISMSKGYMGPLVLDIQQCKLLLELLVVIGPPTPTLGTQDPNSNDTNTTMTMTTSPNDGFSITNLRVALRYVSSIGGGFSLGCLIITIFTLIFFREMRNNQSYQILIYLCTSLAFFYFGNFFVTAAVVYSKVCTALAVFLHFFLMSSVILMLLVGLYLCIELILVKKWWNTYITNIICSTCGYGIPAFVVIVCLINNTSGSIYGFNASGYCWMSRIWADATFVYPMVGLLGVNCCFFIIIIFKLINMNAKDRQFHLYRVVIPSAGLAFTLGLPWLFSIVAIHTRGTTQIVFSVIFTTLSALQGVFIFFYYVIFNRIARRCWLHLLCGSPLPTETHYTSTNGKVASHYPTEMEEKNKLASSSQDDITVVRM